MKKTFSISEAISFGWNTFKSNWKFWIIAFLIAGVATGSSGLSGVGNLSRSGSKQTSSVTETVGRELPSQKYPVDSNKVLGVSVSNPIEMDPPIRQSTHSKSLFLFLIPFVILTVVGFLAFGFIGILVSTALRMGYIDLTLDAARNKQVYYKTILNQMSLKKAYRFLIANFLVSLNVVIGLILFIIPGILYALKYYYVPYLVVDKDMKPREAMKESSKLTKGVRFKLLSLSFVFGLISILGILVFGVGVIPASIVISIANAYVFNKLLEQSGMQADLKSTEIPSPTVNSGNLLADNLSIQDSLTVTE